MEKRHPMRNAAFGALAVSLLVGAGCSSEPSEPAARPAPSAVHGASVGKGAAAPARAERAEEEQVTPDHVRTATYHLRAIAETQYQQGQMGQFSVELKPKAGWHVNMDYPFAVEVLSAEGLRLPKKKLEKADAASYSENEVRLDVPFTPQSPGERVVRMHVDFAVCTPDSCVPEQRTLSVRFRVDG